MACGYLFQAEYFSLLIAQLCKSYLNNPFPSFILCAKSIDPKWLICLYCAGLSMYIMLVTLMDVFDM